MENALNDAASMRQLALASVAATAVALLLLMVQAALMYRARRHLERVTKMMLVHAQCTDLESRNRFELNVLDSRRRLVDDRLNDLQRRVPPSPPPTAPNITFVNKHEDSPSLPPPPTQEELMLLVPHVAGGSKSRSGTPRYTNATEGAQDQLGGMLTILNGKRRGGRPVRPPTPELPCARPPGTHEGGGTGAGGTEKGTRGVRAGSVLGMGIEGSLL